MDIVSQKLELIGSLMVPRMSRFSDIVEDFVKLTNSFYGKNVLSSKSSLRVFEECRAPVKISEYDMNQVIHSCGIVTGDILCFCLKLSESDLNNSKAMFLKSIVDVVPETSYVYI